jgi:selenide,water dikinase
LILTKGLGTGTITSALKSKKAETRWVDGAIRSMCTLNKTRDLLGDATIHAATDITGFGLAGHALQMCRASRVRAHIQMKNLPVLEGAMECLELGVLNKAHHSNASYVAEAVHYEDVSPAQRWLTVDPQTSGGLLLAVPPHEADALVVRLRERFPLAARIGTMSQGDPALVFEA